MRYTVKGVWRPLRRGGGMTRRYLVLNVESEEEACQRLEQEWAGKQGGVDPHVFTAEPTGDEIFELRW